MIKWISFKNHTPLQTALLYYSMDIGKLLILKGADINAKDIIYLNIQIFFLINLI